MSLCASLAVFGEPNFGNALHPGQDVIDCLTPLADEIRSHNFRHKIRWNFQDFLGRDSIEPFAKNRGHRFSEGLDMGAEGDAEGAGAGGSDFEEYTYGIGALLVLSDILEIEGLAIARALTQGGFRISNQGLSFFRVGQLLKKIDDLI